MTIVREHVRMVAAVVVALAVAAAGFLTLAPTAQASTSFGSVDGVSAEGKVEGWVLNDACGGNPGASPNGFCLSLFFVYDGPLGQGWQDPGSKPASVHRPDVAAVHGGNGRAGFSVDVPLQYGDGQPHTVYVYADNPPEVDGEPAVLIGQLTFATTINGPRISLDSPTGGWAFDPDTPEVPVEVELSYARCPTGGPVYFPSPPLHVQRVVADEPRPDVQEYFRDTEGLVLSADTGFSAGPPPDLPIDDVCVTATAFDTYGNYSARQTAGPLPVP